MALTDEYRFKATAGRGGDGVVRWFRQKFLPKGGPAGGNGGRGGDVYIEAVRDILILGRISHIDSYTAPAGAPGGSNSMSGIGGEDLTIKLPIGAVVTDTVRSITHELLKDGERIRILRGGAGGLGNEHFKSSTNQQPMQCTKGKEGEEGKFTVELKLIADIGLVGLPNAGKTSLLNALTNAGARVGDYPFTTLDPNLGVFHGYVLADVPGLIEGAAEGKGLGHKFLRHISRTSVILQCISLERDNIADDFVVVKKELDADGSLEGKDRFVVLTKTDTVSEEVCMAKRSELESEFGSDINILGTISVLDDDSLQEFGAKLSSLLSRVCSEK